LITKLGIRIPRVCITIHHAVISSLVIWYIGVIVVIRMQVKLMTHLMDICILICSIPKWYWIIIFYRLYEYI